MVTVDQMIAALEAFKAEHGGDRQVVRPDPFGNYHLMSLEHGAYSGLVVESDRPDYFDIDEDDDNAVPVFVVD